jgi:hypothetical protein
MFLNLKKYKNILKIFCVFLLAFSLFAPLIALAEDTNSGAGGVREGLGEAKAGLPEFTIEEKIGDIISTILGFVGILFLVLMIAGGLMWMTAGGAEEKLGKAKKLITSAVIGMIIVFSAYAITYFVTETLLGR